MKNELKRVKKIMKNALRGDYIPGAKDLKSLGKRQLSKIHSKSDLVRMGIISLDLGKWMEKQVTREERRMSRPKRVRTTPTRSAGAGSGVLSQEGVWEARWTTIMRSIGEGIRYDGHLSHRSYRGRRVDSHLMVNAASAEVERVFLMAEGIRTHQQIIEDLIRTYGSFEEALRCIKKLMLAVYDREYARWGGGSAAFRRDFQRLCDALGVSYEPMIV